MNNKGQCKTNETKLVKGLVPGSTHTTADCRRPGSCTARGEDGEETPGCCSLSMPETTTQRVRGLYNTALKTFFSLYLATRHQYFQKNL